jgi:hypothetical protein
MQYRCERLVTDQDYAVWLDDPRTDGGLVPIKASDLIPDGESHRIQVDVRELEPIADIRDIAVRMIATDEGGAVLEIEKLAFTARPSDNVLSLLDGSDFVVGPSWVMPPSSRSEDYAHRSETGFAEFSVNDPDRVMKWARDVAPPIDTTEWPVLEFQYRADRFFNDRKEYVVFLTDGRETHNSHGFEAVIPAELISDGKPDTIRVTLSRFNPAGPITSVAIRVRSGDEGTAVLHVEKLQFIRPPSEVERKREPEIRNVTRCRGVFEMNKQTPVNLACPKVGGNLPPVTVAGIRFAEAQRRLQCSVGIEGWHSADATFAVRVKVLSKFQASFPILGHLFTTWLGAREFIVETKDGPGGVPLSLGSGPYDLDFGPMEQFAVATHFEVEIEALMGPRAELVRGIETVTDDPKAQEVAESLVSESTALDEVLLEINLIDGRPFVAVPDWVKKDCECTSMLYSQEIGPARVVFRVDEPRQSMKWDRKLETAIDPARLPGLVFRYRADRLCTEDIYGNDYVVWLFDGRSYNQGGFAPILPSDIIPDGQSHEIRVDLSEFQPQGDINEIAIQVFSNDDGDAELEIEKLAFIGIGPPQEEMTEGELQERITRYRSTFELNKTIPVNLDCPAVKDPSGKDQWPITVKDVEFREATGRVLLVLTIEQTWSADATFSIRAMVTTLDSFIFTPPSTETTFKTYYMASDSDTIRYLFRPQKDIEIDLGPMDQLTGPTHFEVEIEDISQRSAPESTAAEVAAVQGEGHRYSLETQLVGGRKVSFIAYQERLRV